MKTITNISLVAVASIAIGLSLFAITNSNNNNAFAQKNSGFDKELNLLNQALTALEKTG
jgi:hypothetical protein